MDNMTRIECELAIAEKFKEIVKIYRSYNPDGKYLTMLFLDDYISFNNEPHHNDFHHPIGYCEDYIFEDSIFEEEEIYG